MQSRNRIGGRGSGRGGGGNRNFSAGGGGGANRSQGVQSIGPLLTDHLRDLDLELGLLKRKREIIEKQQSMLVNTPRFGGSNQFDFDEPRQSFGQPFNKPSRGFVDYYDDPQPDRFQRQPSSKRSGTVEIWDNNQFGGPSVPKRPVPSSGPRPMRRPPPSKFGQNANRKPGFDGASRTFSDKSARGRTDFRPSKVTKPKPNIAPNKLNSLPVSERQNLVDKASDLVNPVQEVLILEKNKPLHPKLVGRLELALGAILHELKTAFGSVQPYKDYLQTQADLRVIKQGIRDRLRSVMAGKAVGVKTETVAVYRQQYPKETDEEFITSVLESNKTKRNLAIEIYQSANPANYFKTNFKKLLSGSLDTMFYKMRKLYEFDPTCKKSLKEMVSAILSDLEPEYKEEVSKRTGKDTSQNGTQNETAAEETSAENTETNKTESSEAENKETVKTENVNTDEHKNNETVDTETTVKVEETAQKDDTNPNDATVKENDNENIKPDAEFTTDDAETFTDDGSGIYKIRAKFYHNLCDSLIKQHLPVILPKYKDVIMKILNTDETFKNTKAYLIKTTNHKAENQQNGADQVFTLPVKRTQYFVKVVGRPFLPNKNVMKAFLDSFNPTLIKRHRRLPNVLFVSFNQAENLQNILANNGTTIDNCKVSITVSDKINRNLQADKSTDDDVAMKDVSNDNDSKILDESLDSQINDLLSSIREEEEKKTDADASDTKEDDVKEITDDVDIQETEQEVCEKTADLEVIKEEPIIIDDANTEENNDPEESTIIEDANTEENNDPETEANAQEDNGAEVNAEKNNDAAETEAKQAPEVQAAKNEANPGTPTRSSARIAQSTPSTIKTRRASKLAQN